MDQVGKCLEQYSAVHKQDTLFSMLVTIVYDNYIYDPTFRPGSGFSCIIRAEQGLVLFDTGGHISTLSFNLQKLGISPAAINIIVISHLDNDHYGGLLGLLERAKRPTVYVPAVFPARYKDKISSHKAEVREITTPQEILPRVFSTGEVGGGIKEQSLVIESSKGGAVIVGCGHPSVTRIGKVARGIIQKPLYMMVGGFHLGGMEEEQLREISAHLKKLGIVSVAPSHCSSDGAIAYLRQEFGGGFIESGVGKTIELM